MGISPRRHRHVEEVRWACGGSIRIAGGSFSLSAGTDCLHAENDEDDSLGWIYIGGGSLSL
ncbi:MAG: carbohydrate-binding domain-containing protein, partial [Bacteroidales bacterium]|nr:carbohydrate-binding domain-containing protein [Bacteroidales bacterium]